MNYVFCLFFSIATICYIHGYSSADKDSESIDFFVSTTGSDRGIGSKSDALRTISEAINRAKQSFDRNHKSRVRILIEEGLYELDNPLIINEGHISESKSSLEIIGLSDKVIISGGKELDPSGWKKSGTVENGTIWAYQFSNPEKIVRQLFKNGDRVSRSSSPVFQTSGPKKEYQARIKEYDHAGINILKSETLEPFCTFEYSNNDLTYLQDTLNAEIVIHHSWESTWHEIGKIDRTEKIVFLTNAFRYPIGFFSKNVSYRVENTGHYFNNPDTWIYDKMTGTIYYYALDEEDPRLHTFTVPSQFLILRIEGEGPGRQVKNIKFSNITFSHSEYAWGIKEVSPLIAKLSEEKYSWMDFTKGYSGTQVAAKSGHSIFLNYSFNVVFEGCRFTNLGTYALKIGRGSSKTVVKNCEFHDNGGGGILIGEDIRNVVRDKFSKMEAPSSNVVTRSKFHNLGLIHPSSVAIAILQSYGNYVSENVIFNLPYTGISLGWKWSEGPNYSQDNLIVDNEIYRVMRLLSDGGGIYTLGDLRGSVIRNNYIHDLSRSDVAIGASINGIFFDQGSTNLQVIGNRIHNIQGQSFKFHKIANKSILLKDNIL